MRRVRHILIPALSVAIALLVVAVGSAGSQKPPSLRLLSPTGHITAYRFPGDPTLFLSPTVYAAATNGPFELQAVVKGSRIEVWRIRRGENGPERIGRLLTPSPATFTGGLPAFFHVAVVDATGTTVMHTDVPFCPSTNVDFARVDMSGPDRSAYPFFCGGDLTKGMVWGIDAGWAAAPSMYFDASGLADGNYKLRLSVNRVYVKQLQIPASDASVTVGLTVTTTSSPPPVIKASAASVRRSASRTRTGERPRNLSQREAHGNDGINGLSSGLPDMTALPAHDLSIENNPNADGHDYLDFGATIWNAGSGPLVVEGFRRGQAPLMQATQIIYRHGKPASTKRIGWMEFDTRPGHNHWHMQDIAQYDLLDASGNRVVLSEKQSFCLAPTDAVDLTKPGADWQPDRTGLSSACAGPDSIWLREVLPAGWGDTYFQNVAGQSFDVTSLPNGQYQVQITTNPDGRILEQSYSNNSSLRPITLGGTPGARTVSTP